MGQIGYEITGAVPRHGSFEDAEFAALIEPLMRE
jgi:hypothetical protein